MTIALDTSLVDESMVFDVVIMDSVVVIGNPDVGLLLEIVSEATGPVVEV